MNIQMLKLVLEKEEDPEIKLPTSVGSLRKQESSRKNIYFFSIDYAKAFNCMNHNKLWKILEEIGIIDQLTCLLRNLYEGQEATVKTRRGTMDWFQIGKGIQQGCILSPCLFNLHASGGQCIGVSASTLASLSSRGSLVLHFLPSGWCHLNI